MYYSRFEEVALNPELGVYTMVRKPSFGDEAAFFGQVWKRVQARDQTVSVAEENERVVGICPIYRGSH